MKSSIFLKTTPMKSKTCGSEGISGSQLIKPSTQSRTIASTKHISLGFVFKDGDSTTSLGETWSRTVNALPVKNEH